MTRVKRGTHAIKRRRALLKKTKGYRFGRSTKERLAKQAWIRANEHAFDHRRDKKGDFRGLWQVKISAGLRPHELSYSKFAAALKKQKIGLNRKSLATIAEHHRDAFARIVEKTQ